jgi:hypothetical protein
MKLSRILVPLVLALSAGVSFADGGGSVPDADVKRWLAFVDKFVDTVVSDKDACPKMGTDLNALIDANKDLIAMANKARADGKQLPPDAVQHMTDAFKKAAGAMAGCMSDPNVKAAVQKLPGRSGGAQH